MDGGLNRTEYLDRDGGRIAYEAIGDGPLVVLSPGMADTRQTYRSLAPLLAAAGHRVVSVDLRGHGESSVGWTSYTHADTAADLAAVIEHLGGPAVVVGQSFSGGAVTILAATRPDLVRAIVEIDPFTRQPKYSLGAMLRNDHGYRRGALRLGRFALTGSVTAWSKYLDVAYPGRKPDDWDTWLAALLANLAEPGRVEAARAMIKSSATLKQAATQLAEVRCPALVVMGSADSDFADPEAEALALVGLLPPGQSSHRMIDGAGHYPHAQYPQQTADAILTFLAEHAGA